MVASQRDVHVADVAPEVLVERVRCLRPLTGRVDLPNRHLLVAQAHADLATAGDRARHCAGGGHRTECKLNGGGGGTLEAMAPILEAALLIRVVEESVERAE